MTAANRRDQADVAILGRNTRRSIPIPVRRSGPSQEIGCCRQVRRSPVIDLFVDKISLIIVLIENKPRY
jgi:hypothetical protein